MANIAVASREYKLMLNTDRFLDRTAGADNFLSLIDLLIKKEGGQIIEIQNKEESRRTSYLDTPEFGLRQNGFALRLREETNGVFQLNLKCRSADRYLSANSDVFSSNSMKNKFEEDILPPFVSKFSRSNTIEFPSMPQINTVKAFTDLFPGMLVLNLNEKARIETAKDFKALEIVCKLCKFQFGSSNTVKASLSFWYLESDKTFPLVSEFSFDYDTTINSTDKLEDYPIALVNGTNRFFRALQNHVGWLDFNTQTKTAFALDVL